MTFVNSCLRLGLRAGKWLAGVILAAVFHLRAACQSTNVGYLRAADKADAEVGGKVAKVLNRNY